MWTCKYCSKNFEFNKTSDKANHSRWCDSNPKKEEYKINSNLKISVIKSKNKKYGENKKYNVICSKCNNNFIVIERQFSFPKKSKYFCSRKCANSHIVTYEQKKKTSESMTGRSYIEPKEVESICICGKKFRWIKKSEKNRLYCSSSCSLKYNPKHFERRKIQRIQRSDLKNYRAECQFKFNINDYPEEFDISLIKKHGWYKAKNRGNNITGISRDHMISVRYGFENKIDPKIIAHPANCQLLEHNKNSSKGKNNSINYDELICKIHKWNEKYK